MKQKISVRLKGCSTKFSLLGAPVSIVCIQRWKKLQHFLLNWPTHGGHVYVIFAAAYDHKSKLLSPAIRILLRQSITLKYTEPLNPNLAGQGSLLAWSQRMLGNPSSTASFCHIFSAIKHWSGYESELPAFPMTHLPKHFPPSLRTFLRKYKMCKCRLWPNLHSFITVLLHFARPWSSGTNVYKN